MTHAVAIARGRTDRVIPFLRDGGDPAAEVDGLALVAWCAYHGDATALTALLDAGAPTAALGPDLGLLGAAFHGHERLVEVLLEHGADPRAADPETGETALHGALAKANRPARDRIVRLLVEAGADVHAATIPGAATGMFMREVRTCGERPLHRAAAYGSTAVIDLLLACGADPAATDAHGETPLAWASRHLRPDAVLRRLCHGPHRIHPDRAGTYDHGSGWSHDELNG
ncbi:MAG: hypothetical protein RLZZ127_2185 [Planctomycetota bacterium]|jgi:ankyrin repeat protein